jgi:hypothetical protein
LTEIIKKWYAKLWQSKITIFFIEQIEQEYSSTPIISLCWQECDGGLKKDEPATLIPSQFYSAGSASVPKLRWK